MREKIECRVLRPCTIVRVILLAAWGAIPNIVEWLKRVFTCRSPQLHQTGIPYSQLCKEGSMDERVTVCRLTVACGVSLLTGAAQRHMSAINAFSSRVNRL